MHGLTRNARDFDFLAATMAQDYRVVCMDFAGRGQSDRLGNPRDYDYPQYIQDTVVLLAHLDAREVHWLGTSMGGILGMLIAATADNPIQRLILNDVGPFIPKAALTTIIDSLDRTHQHPDLPHVEALLRKVHHSFGPLTDSQWRFLAEISSKEGPDGNLLLHYDPDIAIPLKEKPSEDVDLWPIWDLISCPILTLRGKNSEVLTADTAQKMTLRGPKSELVELEGIGHAPTLLANDQITIISQWLNHT